MDTEENANWAGDCLPITNEKLVGQEREWAGLRRACKDSLLGGLRYAVKIAANGDAEKADDILNVWLLDEDGDVALDRFVTLIIHS